MPRKVYRRRFLGSGIALWLCVIAVAGHTEPRDSFASELEKAVEQHKRLTRQLVERAKQSQLSPDQAINSVSELTALFQALRDHPGKPGIALKRALVSKVSPDLLVNVIAEDGINVLKGVGGHGGCLQVHEDMRYGAMVQSTSGMVTRCANVLKAVKARLTKTNWFGGGCIEPTESTMSQERYYNLVQQFVGENFKPKNAASHEAYYAGEDKNRPYIPPLGPINYCAE